MTKPVVMKVSHATRACGSFARTASRTESETWSAILSGWPSVTDSDVKEKERGAMAARLAAMPNEAGGEGRVATAQLSPGEELRRVDDEGHELRQLHLRRELRPAAAEVRDPLRARRDDELPAEGRDVQCPVREQEVDLPLRGRGVGRGRDDRHLSAGPAVDGRFA